MANRDLTIGEPGRIIRSYCLPLFGSVFFQQLYNLADSFVAGRFIGEDALAAVGNGYEITLIFLAVAFGCNTGCSVAAARHFGAKRYDRLRTAVSTALIAAACLCALLMLFGLTLTAPLLRLIRTPAILFDDSRAYLRIYTLGAPFLFFYNISNGIFSALGDSRTPLRFLAASSCANIALDIFFVARLGWGVAGVGWATLICQGAACVPAFILAMRRLKKLPDASAHPLVTRASLKDFLAIAVPGALQQGVVAAANIAIQGVVNGYGAAVAAGYSASVKMTNLVTSCFSTIGSGVTNFTAQNLGAARPERTRAGFRAAVQLVWAVALGFGLLYELFPDRLVGLFLGGGASEAALHAGVNYLRVTALFYMIPAFKMTCDAFLCGCSRMKLVVFSIALDLSLRAGAAALLSAVFAAPTAVWFAWPVGWSIAACVAACLRRRALKNA